MTRASIGKEGRVALFVAFMSVLFALASLAERVFCWMLVSPLVGLVRCVFDSGPRLLKGCGVKMARVLCDETRTLRDPTAKRTTE